MHRTMESLFQAASPSGLESAMQHHLSETFDSPRLRILFQKMEPWKQIPTAQSV